MLSRLVVQAITPYLAVHVNAAFSRLTGMHNSGIIGRPLSKILCLLENDDWDVVNKSKPVSSSKYDEDSNEDGQKQNRLSIERLMEKGGFDNRSYHVITIVDKGDSDKSSDKSNSANEESNNSSITSKEDSFTPMKCTVSICYIISPPTRGRASKIRKQEGQEITHQNQKKESSKQFSHIADTKKVLSHYLIQLKPTSHDDSSKTDERVTSAEDNCESSNSSSSHAKACG